MQKRRYLTRRALEIDPKELRVLEAAVARGVLFIALEVLGPNQLAGGSDAGAAERLVKKGFLEREERLHAFRNGRRLELLSYSVTEHGVRALGDKQASSPTHLE